MGTCTSQGAQGGTGGGGNGKIQTPFGKSGLLAWGVLCRAVKIVMKLYGP